MGKKEQKIDFKEVVDHLVDGVYITDGNAVTCYVNPAYVKHTGIKPEEILGRSVTDIVAEGTLYKRAVSADVIKFGRMVSGSGFIRNDNGRSVYGYVTGNPIFGEDGRVKNVVVSVIDAEKLKNRFNEFENNVRSEDAIKILENFGDDISNPMIGAAQAIRDIRHTIVRAAPTDVTILITGESGVGKEVVADKIFSSSNRADKPFIKVNCTAIPANLLESELFGYEKGAFTGADRNGKAGLFELADKGTIMLDEIGDLPMELQTKLLRVLQQKEVMRIGGSKPKKLDVRVIAVTNADLRAKIQEGKFREDLFYRLSVVPIYVPPLRERRGDIMTIVKFYFNEYCKKHGRSLTLPAETYPMFENYDWPGNVRELQNVIEYLVICSEGGNFDVEKLQEMLSPPPDKPPEGASTMGFQAAVEQYEKKLLESAFLKTGGVRRAAAYLQLDPSTVSRKAKKYGISIKDLKET